MLCMVVNPFPLPRFIISAMEHIKHFVSSDEEEELIPQSCSDLNKVSVVVSSIASIKRSVCKLRGLEFHALCDVACMMSLADARM